MGFFANLLSSFAEEASVMPCTIWFILDEPECPEELL